MGLNKNLASYLVLLLFASCNTQTQENNLRDRATLVACFSGVGIFGVALENLALNFAKECPVQTFVTRIYPKFLTYSGRSFMSVAIIGLIYSTKNLTNHSSKLTI